jgi:hypothetical protein
VGDVGKDLDLGAIGLRRPLHLARREDSVLATAEDEHRKLGHQRRLGEREGHHVEVSEVGLVLEPVVERPDLGIAHGAGEEHLPGKIGGLDDRPEAHRQVGLEEFQRVADEKAKGRQEDSRRWHRGEQHRRRRRVLLEVLLDHQAAHRVADDDRRLGQRGGRSANVLDVVRDPVPAQPLTARCVPVTAEVDRLHRPAAVGEVAEEMLLPAPCSMPGAMYENKRRHQAPLTQR